MLRMDILGAQTVASNRELVELKGASSIELDEKDGIFYAMLYFDLKSQDRSFGLVKISKEHPRRFYFMLKNGVKLDFYGKAEKIGKNWACLMFVNNGLEDAEAEWGRIHVRKVGDGVKKNRDQKKLEDF